MKRFIFCSILCLLLFCFIGCNTSDSTDSLEVLTVNGINVPFHKGEAGIADALGELYSRWIDFSFPEGVDGSIPVLVLPLVESTAEHVTTYSYMLNTQEGELEHHDIKLFGYDALYTSMEEFMEAYADYIIPSSLSDSFFSLYIADGELIPYTGDKNILEEKQLFVNTLYDRLGQGELTYILTVDASKLEDGTFDFIDFIYSEYTE